MNWKKPISVDSLNDLMLAITTELDRVQVARTIAFLDRAHYNVRMERVHDGYIDFLCATTKNMEKMGFHAKLFCKDIEDEFYLKKTSKVLIPRKFFASTHYEINGQRYWPLVEDITCEKMGIQDMEDLKNTFEMAMM